MCFEGYANTGDRVPKLLPCSHTLCLQCLLQLHRNSHRHDKIQCPECRAVCHVGKNGVDGVPTNRYIVDLLELLKAVEPPVVQCRVHRRIDKRMRHSR